MELNINDPKYVRYIREVFDLYQTDKAARMDFSLQSWGSLFPMGVYFSTAA